MTPDATSGQADVFILFGASGDLARRKIFPSLFALSRKDLLDVPVIGVARGPRDLEHFRSLVLESLKQHAPADDAAYEKFLSLLGFVKGDYIDPKTFTKLSEAIAPFKRPLIYLAIPPSMFVPVAVGIAKTGCAKSARLVVEKPFGRDLRTAMDLDHTLREHFPERSILRIDHYLGKESVQNLIYFHLANQFVGSSLNRNSIDHVQITMAETLGMEGRGHFYEEVGAIRDVLQNHMLQVLACFAMECPVGTADEDLRDEKVRVMKAIVPLTPDDVVRGQYEGYRAESGVAPASNVETFAAVRLRIENERWSGVPFYIRVGKRMASTITEIYVKYKPSVWAAIMQDKDPGCSDYLRLRLSPNVEIALGTRVKRSGNEYRGECIELLAKHDRPDQMLPYERLFRDALVGNTELFSRGDMTIAQWRVVENVLGDRAPLYSYSQGSWGPEAANQLLREGRWYTPGSAGPGECVTCTLNGSATTTKR